MHGNCLLTEFNFSIKIFLVNIFLVLNSVVVCSMCRRSVLIVSLGVVLLFRCSAGVSPVPLFCGILIVPSVFRCYAGVSVPMFRLFSAVPYSVVPFSGVPGFIVCRALTNTFMIVFDSEAVTQMYSVIKVFLEISQNS